MKYTNIMNKIKANKRILYLSFCIVLILFCLVLNITFSLMTKDNNTSGANIIVGDLKYQMIINEVELNDSVGTKLPSNTIIGDRIILLKAGLTEQFEINLISKNNIDTKYEITYKVCTDVNCTNFIDTPNTIEIAYHKDTPDINGTIKSGKSKTITLVTDNQSENNYYVQINLNVGYSHNELTLTNQIGTKYSPGSLEGNLSIIAYVNGVEVETFPTEPNYETGITCLYKNGSTSNARGVFRYSTEKGWEVDVFGLNKSLTTCKVDFTEVLKVTYEVLSTRYDCANIATASKPSDPLITYTGNCTVISDTENTDGTHTWRLKLLTSGTLTVNGFMYIDAFLVGGGAGGGGNDGGQKGGGGGYTKTIKNIKLDSVSTYNIVIGAGGAAGEHGNATSAFSISASGGYAARSYYWGPKGGSGGSDRNFSEDTPQDGGSYGNNGSGSDYGVGQGTTTCEFGEGTLSGCTRGDEYAYGGGGGSGGSAWSDSGEGGVGGGGRGAPGIYSGYAGTANTGGGGGGGSYYSSASANGGAGGSGVVVIRDVRT